MSLNTILFDLDGTLLPIDDKAFERLYFRALSAKFTDMYTPEEFIALIWSATKTMILDTSDKTNEVVFMNALEALVQDRLSLMQDRFLEFYQTDFDQVKEAVIENTEIHAAVALLKQKGYTLVIATNPLFPKLAIEKRISWTGLNREDFSYVTSFEENHFCKPQPAFYQEILTKIAKEPGECLMVGNDTQEDLIAGTLGIQTYLITNHAIRKEKGSFSPNHEGDYGDFLHFVHNLPSLI